MVTCVATVNCGKRVPAALTAGRTGKPGTAHRRSGGRGRSIQAREINLKRKATDAANVAALKGNDAFSRTPRRERGCIKM
jgi:hypothetical protein